MKHIKLFEIYSDGSSSQDPISIFKTKNKVSKDAMNIATFISSDGKDADVELVYSSVEDSDENVKVLNVKSIEAARELGTRDWFVTKERSYWGYHQERGEAFFIVYDFSKRPVDREYLYYFYLIHGEVTRALFQDNKDAKEYVYSQPWLKQIVDARNAKYNKRFPSVASYASSRSLPSPSNRRKGPPIYKNRSN